MTKFPLAHTILKKLAERDRQTDRQTDRQRHKETERNRQTDRQRWEGKQPEARTGTPASDGPTLIPMIIPRRNSLITRPSEVWLHTLCLHYGWCRNHGSSLVWLVSQAAFGPGPQLSGHNRQVIRSGYTVPPSAAARGAFSCCADSREIKRPRHG